LQEFFGSFLQKRTACLLRFAMNWARFVASGGGAGLAPKAPGTAGSLVGLVIGAGLLAVSPWCLLGGAVVAAGAGLVATRAATGMPVFNAVHAEDDDPGWIVIDEIAGQMLTMLALPRLAWAGLALAFVLFRVLDIAKPGPIGWADRRGGAAGVMGDDVIAGLSGALLLWAILVTFPQLA
jgi:phosphatidylglycerophosphatase A